MYFFLDFKLIILYIIIEKIDSQLYNLIMQGRY